jgi:hypothetical protein
MRCDVKQIRIIAAALVLACAPLLLGFPGALGGTGIFSGSCAPTVTSVTANSGTEFGGTSVTLAGTCFTGATSATFGGVAGTSLSVVSAISATVTTPGIYTLRALSSTGTANRVDVAVTNSGGTGTLTNGFTYTSEFSRILGSSLLFKEYRSANPANAYNSGALSSYADYGADGAAAVQATSSKQPTHNATGFNGGPEDTCDGTDDYVESTLNTPIANGARTYAWMVLRVENVVREQELLRPCQRREHRGQVHFLRERRR